MSPWKLGSPDEQTVRLEIRLPKSMKDWLVDRAGTERKVSRYLRTMIKRAMKNDEKQTRDLTL